MARSGDSPRAGSLAASTVLRLPADRRVRHRSRGDTELGEDHVLQQQPDGDDRGEYQDVHLASINEPETLRTGPGPALQ